MKLEIYKEREKGWTEPIRLRLVQFADGGVALLVVDTGGYSVSQGHLFHINPDGSAHLYSHVSSDFGFKLTSERRLKLDE